MRDAAVEVNPDVLVLCHGGPIAEPEDAAYVLERTEGVVGFFGASSMERLPTEVAMTENMRRFKADFDRRPGRAAGMTGAFRPAGDVQRDTLDWGVLGWTSGPAQGASRLTVLDVTLEPGFGHDFHKHADQEEVIVVQAGQIEQWLEEEALAARAG